MAVTRYCFAAGEMGGGRVLEIACGTGHGLGLLGEAAESICAGDVEHLPLLRARDRYEGPVTVARFDAEALPFAADSFDAVVMFEAIYYVSDPALALEEAHRVLRPGGKLLLCFPNPAWPDFIRSVASHTYLTAEAALAELDQVGFQPQLYGGFEWTGRSRWARLISATRRMASALGLVPKTMRAKAWLKRLFYGMLIPFPDDLRSERTRFEPPRVLTSASDARPYKVLYAVGVKGQG